MSKVIQVKKMDRSRNELGSFELEIPTSFEELEIVPGKERALSYVVNQMKIEARAKHFPGEAKSKAIVSKGTLSAIRSAIKDDEFSEEDLIAFIKAKRGA